MKEGNRRGGQDKFITGARGLSVILKVIAAMVALATLVLSGYAFIFFMLAILPTIVGFFIDRRASKAASSIIGAFNMVRAMPYMNTMFRSEDIGAAGERMINDIHSWFYIYSTAGIGWMVVWLIPQFWAMIFVARAEDKIKSLRQMQSELAEEWGEEVGMYVQQEQLKIAQDSRRLSK